MGYVAKRIFVKKLVLPYEHMLLSNVMEPYFTQSFLVVILVGNSDILGKQGFCSSASLNTLNDSNETSELHFIDMI